MVEPFEPVEEGKVKMYVCGPTVYGPSHLGHASTYIAFDIIRRAFQYLGYDVTYVVNLTDIHDDMIREANKRDITIFELAEENIDQYMSDLEELNILPADNYPRVTKHIEDIIDTVKTLEEKGFGYETDDGVYYKVSEFEDYGKLSGIKFDKGKTGQRIDTDKYDKDTLVDFALWKKSKPKEPSWDSPWGEGRPGWHIECSVMSHKYLGQPFDIHGGAIDLRFPHHENEIAQSEAAHDKKFVNYWMHAGLLNVDGVKMGKSVGNFINIPELLEQYDPIVLRYWRASVHYRSSINYQDESMQSAKAAVENLRAKIIRWKNDFDQASSSEVKKSESLDLVDTIKKDISFEYKEKFKKALADDFALPKAISILWEVVGDDDLSDKEKLATVLDFDKVLGLGLLEYLQQREEKLDLQTTKKIEELIEKREEARANKDWDLADEIRDELSNMGVVLEDTEKGTKWRKI
jgi:cysteinyl-tRNA synthetase